MMTLQEIYELGIKLGMKADPRGLTGVEKAMARTKKEFTELSEKNKEEFDPEVFNNPYADSRILFGDPTTTVKRIMAGIDIGTGEMVLADRLSEKGEKIDLVLSHHPEGGALAGLADVMHIQIDLHEQAGVPVNVAESLLDKRISEVRRRFWPLNHFQAVDAAKLLNIPLMSMHTATDNLVYSFLKKLIDAKNPETVGDVLRLLKEIPEYKEAVRQGVGPMLFTGSEKRRAGKVVPIEITGGTEGSKELYEKMSQAGVGTIVAMHASEEHRTEAEKHHLNLVIAGHISSDSLGMNLLLDEIEKRGVSILPCSGLIRVKR
ncbi:MAG: NGG1p interacting factor NIF3 [Patescibacteria group bacterium]